MGNRVRTLAGAVAVTVVAWRMASCSTSGCTDNQNSLPLAGFYNTAGTAMSLDSIEVRGIGQPGDSMLYTPGTRLSEIYLPFRSTATSTSFRLHYCNRALNSEALDDIITFNYTSTPYFAGEECGAMFRYHIDRLEYTRHLIDSVAIVDSLITNKPVQQIHIIFRTADAEEGDNQ